jgi:hypothetical protein
MKKPPVQEREIGMISCDEMRQFKRSAIAVIGTPSDHHILDVCGVDRPVRRDVAMNCSN